MPTKNDLKFIKSLRLKKYRIQEKQYVIEGRKSIEEALRAKMKVSKLLLTETYYSELKQQNLLGHQPYEIVTQRILESISSFQSNDSGAGILPILPMRVPDRNGVHIVLDGVRDPGNLGTIIRSVDWFGFDTLICSPDCADFFNPKTISATMGSFTRIQPIYLELEQYLSEFSHLPVFGMALGGESLESTVLLKDAIYVLGSESHGIRSQLLPSIHHQIAISQFGQAESLNVAMATSILLYTLRLRTV